jgi:hypothetical protein
MVKIPAREKDVSLLNSNQNDSDSLSLMHKTSNTVPFPGDGSLKFTPFTLNNL